MASEKSRIIEVLRCEIKGREQLVDSISSELADLSRALEIVERFVGIQPPNLKISPSLWTDNSPTKTSKSRRTPKRKTPLVQAAVDPKPQPPGPEENRKRPKLDPSLKCNYCKKQCLNIRELIAHKKTHNQSTTVSPDPPTGPQSGLNPANLNPPG